MEFVSPGWNWSLCHPQWSSAHQSVGATWVCEAESDGGKQKGLQVAFVVKSSRSFRTKRGKRRNAHLARWGPDDSSALWRAWGDKTCKVTIAAGKITTSNQRLTMTRLNTSASANQVSGNSNQRSYRPAQQPVYGRSWPFMTVLKHVSCVSIGMGCIYNNLPKKWQIAVNHLVLAMTLWILKS